MSKRSKPERFSAGAEHIYWPVYDGTQLVALCPSNSGAQHIVEALKLYETKKKPKGGAPKR